MHIPDSIISPSTSAAATVAMLPVWALAARRVRDTLSTRQVPLLALGSAFCFVIMMFNIPALGGTTAHPVAGTLMAVLLGPWAACIGVSVTLGIQALFFGDGGLLAFGANCFAMAFALPFVGYSLYRVLCGNRPPSDPLRPLFAGIGAYVALNVAAAIVAVFLGVQPALFREPNGQAIYFPFGLKVTLPAMLLTHLLVAGPAEAVVTALALRYLQTLRIPFYQEGVQVFKYSGIQENSALSPQPSALDSNDLNTRTPEYLNTSTAPHYEPLWIGLLALVALTPLGLLATGDAWGEWDAEGLKAEIQKVEGKEYVPRAVAEAEETGYAGIRGLEDYASERGGWAYIGAGALGLGTIVLLLLTSGRFLARRDTDDPPDNGGKGVQAEALLSPENRDTRTPEAPTPAPKPQR